MLCSFLHSVYISFGKTIRHDKKWLFVNKIADYVSQCLQFAILLEVSAYPKPGNVHRIADFQDTKYEHFLASTIAISPYLRHAAERGLLVHRGKIGLDEVGIGKIIEESVRSVNNWQSGGNTILGSVILLSPMAVAAGITLNEQGFSFKKLREKMKEVVESSTPLDAVRVYNAIGRAKPGGLGKAPKLDATSPKSKDIILRDEISLYEVFKIAAKYDSIAAEWVKNYSITFDLGYPYFNQIVKDTGNVNIAIVHTFLKILSEVPDTLIARKVSLSKAEEVTAKAKQVLENDGLETDEGRQKLEEFDKELRDTAHRLNPGTTADIVTAVLAVSILDGYRP